MITIQTDYPIAMCNDHFHPNGTKNDNYSSWDFINEVNSVLGKKISVLDLGCAGGQLVVDFNFNGDYAIGLEGSDFNIKRCHPNWVKHHGVTLFTCDVSKPFSVLNSYIVDCGSGGWGCCSDEEFQQFDLITAWELIEHLTIEELSQFIDNVEKHLYKDGLFVGTISTVPDSIGDIQYHHSVYPERLWKEQIFPDLLTHTNLKLVDYPFKNKVRDVPNSFAIGLKFK